MALKDECIINLTAEQWAQLVQVIATGQHAAAIHSLACGELDSRSVQGLCGEKFRAVVKR